MNPKLSEMTASTAAFIPVKICCQLLILFVVKQLSGNYAPFDQSVSWNIMDREQTSDHVPYWRIDERELSNCCNQTKRSTDEVSNFTDIHSTGSIQT
jgi:hypothetical protein